MIVRCQRCGHSVARPEIHEIFCQPSGLETLSGENITVTIRRGEDPRAVDLRQRIEDERHIHIFIACAAMLGSFSAGHFGYPIVQGILAIVALCAWYTKPVKPTW